MKRGGFATLSAKESLVLANLTSPQRPPSAYVIIVCLLHKKVSIRQHISVGYMEIEDNQASTEKHEGKLESFAGVAQLVEQLIRNQ